MHIEIFFLYPRDQPSLAPSLTEARSRVSLPITPALEEQIVPRPEVVQVRHSRFSSE